MDSVTFVVPGLGSERDRDDLGNVINGQKGVGDVRFDTETHHVTVRFDPGYTTGAALRGLITGTGYAVESMA